jgi:membrane protease YdiL (CAAX protease family)
VVGASVLFGFGLVWRALFEGMTRGLVFLFLYALPLGLWWVSSRRRGHSLRDVMGSFPTLRQLAFMLAVVLPAQAFCIGWIAALASLDLIPKYWMSAAQARSVDTAPTWPNILAISVVVPCAEEILFRGIPFGSLSRRMRPMLAAICSSLVFGTVHLDIVGLRVRHGHGYAICPEWFAMASDRGSCIQQCHDPIFGRSDRSTRLAGLGDCSGATRLCAVARVARVARVSQSASALAF